MERNQCSGHTSGKLSQKPEKGETFEHLNFLRLGYQEFSQDLSLTDMLTQTLSLL